MKTLIVDANVAIKWFLPEIHKNEALRLLNPGYSLHVPSLFLLEFGSVVTKKLRRQEISLEVAHQVIAKVQTIPLKWHPDAPLFPSAFDIAHETYRSLYDCLYLSLALALNGQMVTADLKFYEALKTGPYAPNLLWVEDIPQLTEPFSDTLATDSAS